MGFIVEHFLWGVEPFLELARGPSSTESNLPTLLPTLAPATYAAHAAFVAANPTFIALTRRRATSSWEETRGAGLVRRKAPRRLPGDGALKPPLEVVYTFRIMSVAKVFRHGNSQAVRIPREYRVEGSEVEISRVGRVLILRPRKLSYADALAAVAGFKGKLRRSQDADQDRQAP